MKIALGTAQFGLDYGIANNTGRVSNLSVKKILEIARSLGVDVLDTAAAYGCSEHVLGNNGVDAFKVITKLPPIANSNHDLASWVSRCVNQSLANLKSDSLYGLLLHRPLELKNSNGRALYHALVDLKKQGAVQKIGISVYGPEDLAQLSNFEFDVVQAPMNVLDQRIKDAGWLTRLKENGVEIHIRSAFLQGLLLMADEQRPEYFKPWLPLLSTYDAWVQEQRLTPLQACLGFLNGHTEIDKIVVGVNTSQQLQDIISASTTQVPPIPESIKATDLKLINPALWVL
ncbi:aldo/keto reductase [Ectothiorhodospira shaposhnikovii]|uniref:aldo/keto reductase n=1 Tax=Ectothiorhodospira shaposhnikovii TaxID=1054 RepID=UPI0039A0D312